MNECKTMKVIRSLLNWIKEHPLIFLLLLIAGCILFFLLIFVIWVKPLIQAPFSESLNLPQDEESRYPDWQFQFDPANDTPVCGEQEDLLILIAGIDYRSEDYLYGLADVIRLVHIDMTVPRVNVVALPRALLVDVPEGRIDVDGPILLNQAYFFGTPGMQKYAGSGDGAGALAEVIQYNFNLNADHYIVIDFQGFSGLIDALGGIEVDLPTAIDAGSAGFFPAGKQVLNGEQALLLARTRKNYSDNVRISNQTLIIQGIFNRITSLDILLKLPDLMMELKESVLTDAAPRQIQDALCLINNLDSSKINYFQPEEDIIFAGWEVIPSMDKEMNIYEWNETFLQWLFESLYNTP